MNGSQNIRRIQGLSKKEAVAVAAKELGLPKKDVYKESLKIYHTDDYTCIGVAYFLKLL